MGNVAAKDKPKNFEIENKTEITERSLQGNESTIIHLTQHFLAEFF